ncbi:branched-chain amino acid ABC transporter permease [Archaeoglobus sp.]|uniref:branched-chain amino acid ABC transporter permease n=1 Tax=Archaeoglobus sp. TaxID=1872626 RepID=UPI000EEE751E|nr:branched-chain amino acid ABC transporter permease [Archaeoglobus sp.]MDI3497054.1 branched-chain amino acid transport system permease protein [Archaeoglobus sp.]HAE62138.1 branched-chain amino acid ABC transporter permease [Eubacteriaceae bacterium]
MRGIHISILFFVFFIVLPLFLSSTYYLDLLIVIFLYASLALSWDILARTGQISFAHHAFFGIGAYVSVLLYLKGVNPLVGMVAGGFASAMAAFLLGLATLRLRGMYFAIATLAFAGFIHIAVLQLSDYTGGAGGITLDEPLFGGNIYAAYSLALLICLVTITTSLLLERSRLYYAMKVIANNETVAKTIGINVTKTILLIFTLSSIFPGVIGAYYVHYIAFVNPEIAFNVGIALAVLAMGVFGGMGTTFGPVLGAAILRIVEEQLRVTITYGHMIVYGIILIAVILLFPTGLLGLWEKVRRRVSSSFEGITQI